jgi:hypothetical protein
MASAAAFHQTAKYLASPPYPKAPSREGGTGMGSGINPSCSGTLFAFWVMAFPLIALLYAENLQAYVFRATQSLSGASSVPPKIIFYDKVF